MGIFKIISGAVSLIGKGTTAPDPLYTEVTNLPATQAVSLASLPELPAGDNLIGSVEVTVLPALPAGGNTVGNVGLVAGTDIVGKVGIDQTTNGTTNGVHVKNFAHTAIAGQGMKTVPTVTAQAITTTLACRTLVLVSDDGAMPKNLNDSVIWVGGAGVAVGSGIPIRPGASFEVEIADAASIYCISAVANQKLTWVAAS